MSEAPVFAVLGLYPSAQALTDAVPKVQAAGFKQLEAYTPYPVHRLDEVLGFRRSPLGVIVLVMGVLGALFAMTFQGWANAIDYPYVVGGKPVFSWQAFVPVMFEVTVLFATFSAGLAMLFVLNKLPFFGHPVLGSKSIASITRDKFALSIERDRQPIDVEAAIRAHEAAGAQTVEVVRGLAGQPEPPKEGEPRIAALVSSMGPTEAGAVESVEAAAERGLSPRGTLRIAGSIAIACGLAGAATYAGVKWVMTVAPITHIQDQPKLNPQDPSAFFADGRGMRLPVAGTVARGHLPYLFKTPEEAAAVLVNPLPRSERVMNGGRKLYNDHCSVCHGSIANGQATLSSAYGAKPANLQSAAMRDMPDGQIFHAIMVGKNAMPAYAADLSPDERWAVVHYVRALQRSQNAREEDVR